jgi:hypothetical protein
MSVEWIEHKGTRVLFADHRDCSPSEMINDLDLAAKMVREMPPENKVRFLINVEGATFDSAVMARLKELGKEVGPVTEKSAYVGMRGIRSIFLSAYNRVTGAAKTQKLFDIQEEALEWLASD